MSDSESIIGPVDVNAARLYGIVARTARRAVIFRRGPSKRVRLLVWDLKTDSVAAGQWFKGRVYERRCDLAPDGEGLVYFAASFRQPFYSWTAISKPPFFTAIALWPKGDCWGGGGLFESNMLLRLNHQSSQSKLADGFVLPRRFRITSFGAHSGRGEDDPVMSTRLSRDGWTESGTQSTVIDNYKRASRFGWLFDPPLVSEKSVRVHKRTSFTLRKSLHAVNEYQGRWYVETAELIDQTNRVLHTFGRIDWADFDHNGDVIFGKGGCLFRLVSPATQSYGGAFAPQLIVDLNAMEFEPVAPSAWARNWE